jgi:hypothetical protein
VKRPASRDFASIGAPAASVDDHGDDALKTPVPSPARRSPADLAGRALCAAALLAMLPVLGCSEMEAMNLRLRNALVGPSGPQAPPEGTILLQPLAPVRRDIYTRSYRLGDAYVAKIGDPVVSIKNYAVTEKVGRATVLRDFGQLCKRTIFSKGSAPTLCQSAPLDAVRGAMGSVYDVVAAVTLPDGQYFAVAIPSDGTSQVYLLVDPTGRLRRGSYVAWREQLTPGTTLGRVPLVELKPELALPSDEPLFSFESVEKFVYMGPNYLSFDLVFTGTRDTLRGELMTFNYREYGRDNTERPTFERPLSFSANEPVIEVDKLRIEVEPIGYTQLRFRVIADGQPTPTTTR